MPRVVHFELHAEQPERAIEFYKGLFGWEFTRWGGEHFEYWLIKTGPSEKPGLDGGLVRRRGPGPSGDVPVVGYVCSIDVESVDATVAAVLNAGGTIALPKMPVPTVGWLAYVKDTEGNLLGLYQQDPTAA